MLTLSGVQFQPSRSPLSKCDPGPSYLVSSLSPANVYILRWLSSLLYNLSIRQFIILLFPLSWCANCASGLTISTSFFLPAISLCFLNSWKYSIISSLFEVLGYFISIRKEFIIVDKSTIGYYYSYWIVDSIIVPLYIFTTIHSHFHHYFLSLWEYQW